MKKIAPLGKKSYTGKKFKSAGPNELNASDKNYIRKNIHLFNIQLLASKVGKPLSAVEKFIKKEKLVSNSEVQAVKEFIEQSIPVVESQTEKESQKATKTSKLIKINLSAETQPIRHDKAGSQKEEKAVEMLQPKISVETQPSEPAKEGSQKEKKAVKALKTKVSVKTQPSKYDKTASQKEKKETKPTRDEVVSKKVDFIRENYPKYSAIELAKMMNASITGVRYHIKNLNVVKTPYKVVKTPPEVLLERQRFIKENHEKYTVRELSEQLNCSGDIVRIALRKMKIKALQVPLGQEISPQAINFIKANYRTMTAREMSDALGNVRWTQIKYLCEKYGFLKTPEETTAIRNRWNRSEFTVSEEKYIIMNHGIITLSEIAKNLQRTRSSVITFLSRKGLKITKEQHSILNRKNFEKARLKFQEKLKENISSEE